MTGRLSDRVLSWIDSSLAAFGHGFIVAWTKVERSYRRPFSQVALRLKFAFYPLLALGANVASVIILLKWRDGDSNVRSVWLCSRNDAIGNVAVIVAGLLVAATASALPDLLVAIMLAGLFLRSSIAIARQAMSELRSERLHLERGESR